MGWIKQRVTDDGDKRFEACFRDPEGRHRSAGTFSSRRAAERAANWGTTPTDGVTPSSET